MLFHWQVGTRALNDDLDHLAAAGQDGLAPYVAWSGPAIGTAGSASLCGKPVMARQSLPDGNRH